MNYFVVRGESQYGPYSLADLERYVASGDILPMDIVRSDGLPAPVPVSQVLGLPAAPPAMVRSPQPAAPTIPPYVPQGAAPYYPDPPNLHWGLVLLFGVFTCGLFLLLWEIIQAAWVKKVEPQSKALTYYLLYVVLWIFFFFMVMAMHVDSVGLRVLVELLYLALFLVARYSMRASLVRHFNLVEPMGLLLGGVMTFFFGSLYFQYHLSNIVLRKQMARQRGF